MDINAAHWPFNTELVLIGSQSHTFVFGGFSFNCYFLEQIDPHRVLKGSRPLNNPSLSGLAFLGHLHKLTGLVHFETSDTKCYWCTWSSGFIRHRTGPGSFISLQKNRLPSLGTWTKAGELSSECFSVLASDWFSLCLVT